MKHRIVHTLQKYVLNPPIRFSLAIGLPLPGYALLETKGRKTGKPRRTPVGDGRIGNKFWLVAEHGMRAAYVRNIERGRHVRLKLCEGLRYRWHTGTAHLLSDDDPRERQRWLATQLPSSAGNARAVRHPYIATPPHGAIGAGRCDVPETCSTSSLDESFQREGRGWQGLCLAVDLMARKGLGSKPMYPPLATEVLQ